MAKLWVKFQANNATQVSTEECQNVDDFLEACKKKLSNKLDSYDSDQLSLSTTEAGQSLDRDVLLTQIPLQPGYSVNGSKYPLFISVTENYSQGNFHPTEGEKATFDLYAWKATKNPDRKDIVLDLKEGRMPLKALLIEERIKSLYRIEADGSNVRLLADDDGFSIQKWKNGERYKLRFKTDATVDIEISFSEKDRKRMNILTVRDDFGFEFEQSRWSFGGDSFEFPVALTETLALYAQFNTLRLEASRRSIVSLFLHYAIASVPEGKSGLCIDEETPLSITRSGNRYGDPKNVRYSGPVDFVIGHSKILSNMPEDAVVMVIETKKSDTFDGSLPQVLAQAGALLYFRRGMKRGLNGTGGPIVFIRSDGERWIFSKLTCDKGNPAVQHSAEFKLSICQNEIDNETVQQIFNWIRYAIILGRDSSPRSSLVAENGIVDDEDTITAEFAELKINI